MAHILLLTDRDWTHPQGGGTGANLFGQVAYWLEWGHKVTVVAGTYDGAERVSTPAEGLELHHMGSRRTVFARAAWAVRRGLARDADVVLEVVNGIAFLTPLWLSGKPRVTLVHHIHRDHYVTELGRVGAVAALALETAPLKLLYGGSSPFLTISESAKADIVALGVPAEDVHVGYLGVVPFEQELPPRSETPRLLYLGRLKRYKRIELLLDVLEGIPGAVLDVAGEGDHRPDLEAEIARRGLGDRVILHGHVSEDVKASLYATAWVNLTASSAEGWCLTVMEAATCGTPSAALAVGGLPESIVDGETGLLADDVEGLVTNVRRLVEEPGLRQRMGAAAQERAARFTWARTAQETLDVLEAAREREPVKVRTQLSRSETLKAVGMAAATMVNNAFAVVFTVLFARLLGAEDYGSLAAVISTFVILAVPGSALQVAVAREVALGRLGSPEQMSATLWVWRRRLLMTALGVAVAAVLLRQQIADLISVDEVWAAAATLPTGALWLLLSVERGALQGVHAYKPVAWSVVFESAGRVGFGILLFVAGLGVTGAYLGTPLALLATALGLWWVGRHRFPLSADRFAPRRLLDLVGGAWPAVVGLLLIAMLQNVDVIMVKRQIGGDAAGAYAAAAVAAKAVVWVAIGIGLYLLPEATRAARDGRDPRPVLARALAVVGAVAVPMLIVYAIAPATVLRLAFGPETVVAADALFVLGCAMTLLAIGYLAVQYMLALGRVSFLPALAAVAVAEIALLGGLGIESLVTFAAIVLGLQAAAALSVLAIGLLPGRRTVAAID
ncbi:glycosyltransferase involved in cell wall biosynthesis [Solirubrobacter pauli]|uniref:Glycosyltransferase involved in cell wall biosynthesis n=1 Tax=Solirubrobacter pauli TaxID=166793 RepID=A0A660KY55_9ACTN|nr:glycosyltransferase [Solirubrobacter pauli]RKQ86627.1 glycosyltransferase involved in cell wall biosynthesis [Solirubrobacter pauli]